MPPKPAGSKTTDLAPVAAQAARTGFLSRVASAVRYAIAGVQPDTWMSPLQPISPVAQQAAGRVRDYPTGYNMQYRPRGEELTSFEQLRAVADRCDLVRLSIETRKDQMASMDWTIAHTDPSKDVSEDAEVMRLIAMFKRPDGQLGWQGWIRMLMEEVLVTDAATIYPRKLVNGNIYAFEVIDGATIKPLIDGDGRRPMPPSPAYQQQLKGVPAVDYSADELVYVPRNPRVHKFYGFSPVEQILLTINIALRRATGQLQYYTEGNIPAAFASLPTDWTPAQIREFQEYWDAVLEGDQGYKRKVKFVPGDTKVAPVAEPPLKTEIDEWLARLVSYAFSLPPTPLVKDMNRATSDVQQEAALQQGLQPIKVWVKETMDWLLSHHIGRPDLEFKWVEEEALDPMSQATILTTYQKTGTYSINEIRAKLGDDPIDDGDEYLVYTGSGAMKLSEVLNPPATPPPGVVDPLANPQGAAAAGTQPPAAGGGDDGQGKPQSSSKPPESQPKPQPAHKHAEAQLAKVATPLTEPEQVIKAACLKAFRKMRTAAVEALPLRKAAPVTDDDRGGTGYDDASAAWVGDYVSSLDLSPMSIIWDDLDDTLQSVAADGSRQEIARIIADPDLAAPAAPGAPAAPAPGGQTAKPAFDMFGHQDENAVAWAKDHAGSLITKDGNGGELADATRNMIRMTLEGAIKNKATDAELAKILRECHAFSEPRAELIARTEVKNALGRGALEGAKAVGMKSKRWLVSNDENTCGPCNANAAQGWIPIDKPFVSGAMAPGQHPRCQCDTAYRRKPVEE